MPELRSGVRKGRAPVVEKGERRNPRSEHLVGNYIKTRAAAAKEAAEKKPRKGNRKLKEKEEVKEKEKEEVIVIVSEEDKEKCEEGDKKMGDASGGLSANRVTGQEEEGSTAPFPERVSN